MTSHPQTKCSCGTCSTCIARRRHQLRKIEPSSEACAVPGCEIGKVTDDCCYAHSLQSTAGGKRWLPNDGIIDWQAIDLTVTGARTVGLTWVEAEIAVGTMIARGLSQEEILARLDINIKAGSPRCIAYHRVAHAVLNG